MWRESARLWEASLGIIGMLWLMIGFGIAASFALNNAKRKQDGESARLAPKPSLEEEIDAILGATPCTCNAGSRKHAVEKIAALFPKTGGAK